MNKPLTNNQLKYHSFMYSLVYPAVLGTMMVGLVLELTNGHLSFNDSFWWALFLIAYFSSQHVENVLSPEGYNGWVLCLDLVEVAVIFWLFLLLGMFVEENVVETDWRSFCVLLTIAFLIPLASRLVTVRTLAGEGWLKSLHAGLAAFLSLFAVFVGSDLSLLVLLSLIFLSYMTLLVFKLKPVLLVQRALAHIKCLIKCRFS